MIPVRQTVFVHESGKGNCMSACIASILELPLNEVIDSSSDEVRKKGFWNPICDWLEDRNYYIKYKAEGDIDLIGNYSIGIGPSPRGDFKHAVVCKNGIMVFDPHPSDDGLRKIEKHLLITPMKKDI